MVHIFDIFPAVQQTQGGSLLFQVGVLAPGHLVYIHFRVGEVLRFVRRFVIGAHSLPVPGEFVQGPNVQTGLAGMPFQSVIEAGGRGLAGAVTHSAHGNVYDIYAGVDGPGIGVNGIAAAFMLGAIGVQMGTRFLVAKECNVHEVYKKKILQAKDIDTMTTGKRLGHPVRALKTPFAREFLKMEYNSNVTDQELEAFGAGSLRAAAVLGDEKKGSFMSGQIAGLVKKEQTAQEIIEEIFTEAEEILGEADLWIIK